MTFANMKPTCFIHIFVYAKLALALRPADIYSHEVNLSSVAAHHALAEIASHLGPDGNLINCIGEAHAIATNHGGGRNGEIWGADTWTRIGQDITTMKHAYGEVAAITNLEGEVLEAKAMAIQCQTELDTNINADKVKDLTQSMVACGEIVKKYFQPAYTSDDVPVFRKGDSGLLLQELLDIPAALSAFYAALGKKGKLLDCFFVDWTRRHRSSEVPPQNLIGGSLVNWVKSIADLYRSPGMMCGNAASGWYGLVRKCGDDSTPEQAVLSESEINSQKLVVNGFDGFGVYPSGSAAKHLDAAVTAVALP